MMMIAGLGQVQELLQKPVDGGRRKEIAATHHLRHPLGRIVADDSEVLARRRIAASERHVAEGLRLGRHRVPAGIGDSPRMLAPGE